MLQSYHRNKYIFENESIIFHGHHRNKNKLANGNQSMDICDTFPLHFLLNRLKFWIVKINKVFTSIFKKKQDFSKSIMRISIHCDGFYISLTIDCPLRYCICANTSIKPKNQ